VIEFSVINYMMVWCWSSIEV